MSFCVPLWLLLTALLHHTTGAQEISKRALRSALGNSSLSEAADTHDDVLNYTFTAQEFNVPWGDSPLTNSAAGTSFGVFHADSDSLHHVNRLQFDPWSAYNKHHTFCLRCAFAKTLSSAAGASNISQVAVFVHGFLDNAKGLPDVVGNVTYGSWPVIAAAMYAAASPRKNLGVTVDWEAGASGFLHYSRAMSTTRVIGMYLLRVLEAVRDVFGSNVRTWCVGQSLGAHVCGLAAKYAKLSGVAGWNVISALDPAGPSITFLRSVSTSWVNPAFANARLNPNDAPYTEALYTDWGGLGFHGVLSACIDKKHWYSSWQFKDCTHTPTRLGHIEAYVDPSHYTASGSAYPAWLPDQAFVQPGCNHLKLFCSHHYSKNLLLYSLSQRMRGTHTYKVHSNCGKVDMAQEPLNICPRGSTGQTVGILIGASSHYINVSGPFRFDGSQAPPTDVLDKRFPEMPRPSQTTSSSHLPAEAKMGSAIVV